jgi:hypothetical protein
MLHQYLLLHILNVLLFTHGVLLWLPWGLCRALRHGNDQQLAAASMPEAGWYMRRQQAISVNMLMPPNEAAGSVAVSGS